MLRLGEGVNQDDFSLLGCVSLTVWETQMGFHEQLQEGDVIIVPICDV